MRLVHIGTGCNGGLALGYTLAIRALMQSTCGYVLFLNSDSQVTQPLLQRFDEIVRRSTEPVLALAPSLISAGAVVSPFKKAGIRHPFWIISFLFIHRSVLSAEFKFPAEYWLDGIDFWLSHHLWTRSIPVVPIPVRLEHRLSVAEGFRSIPGWRYRNVLASEVHFYRMHGAPGWATLRLFLRGFMRCALNGRFDLLREIWCVIRDPLQAASSHNR